MKNKITLITFVTLLTILCLFGFKTDTQANESEVELNKIPVEYQQYNLDRMIKSAVQTRVYETEVNALLHVAKVHEWDMRGHVDNLGKFNDITELFTLIGQDPRASEKIYEAYIDSLYGPIDEVEFAEIPTEIDYLAVSDIEIKYFYSEDTTNLIQFIRVGTEDRVVRGIFIYYQDGTVKEYYEV